ncbi:MAG: FadR family transcriptional regulator [Trueperaceae bacterium]|nr:FadR family transcriptional regulator [Trueperaceae bacterium]
MTRLVRETLPDIAARELIAFVRTERLRPGDSLPSEAQLAERFGVSRPVIREALQILHGRGLIDARRHRSATVSRPSGGQIAAFVEHHLLFDRRGALTLLEFRRGIEMESAKLAAERADARSRAQLRRIVGAMAAAVDDTATYVDGDIALHQAIATASENPLIATFLASARNATRETIELGLRSRMSDEELRRVQSAHEVLVDAIVQGDAEAAVLAMAGHFDDALRTVRRMFDANA